MAQRTAVIILGVCLGLVSGCGSTAAEFARTSRFDVLTRRLFPYGWPPLTVRPLLPVIMR
jgi:hypothetical protein